MSPYWVSGFTAGDGGFSIGFRPGANFLDIFYFRFHIAQHYRDVELMNKFVQFFECGNVNVRIKDSRCDFYVQDFNKIYNNIIPHFDNYPLQNIKHLDFADFKKVVDLIYNKQHLTEEGLSKIKSIKLNMNLFRKF